MKYFLICFLLIFVNVVHSRSTEEILRLTETGYEPEKLLEDEIKLLKETTVFNQRKNTLLNIYYLKQLLIPINQLERLPVKIKYINLILKNAGDDNSRLKMTINHTLYLILMEISDKRAEEYLIEFIKYGKNIDRSRFRIMYHETKAGLSAQNGRYDESIKSYSTVVKLLNSNDSMHRASIFNNLAYCHGKLGNREKQFMYITRALKIMDNLKTDNGFKCIIMKNLGDYYSTTKEHDKAYQIYLKSFQESVVNRNYSSAIVLLSGLNKLFKNGFSSSNVQNEMLGQVLQLQNLVSDEEKQIALEFKVYYGLMKKQDVRKDLNAFEEHREKLRKRKLKYIKLVNDSFSAIIESTVKDRSKAELDAIQTKAEKMKIMLTSSILTLFLLLIMGILVFRNLKSQKTILKQQSTTALINEELIRQKLITRELENSQLNLNLIVKNEAEQAFLYELKRLKRKRGASTEEVISDLQIKITQLLEFDKRSNFKDIISKEKESMINEIGRLCPNLTNLEQKLIMYFSLDMKTKEIASLLDMSEGSIRVYKNRIRKKVDFQMLMKELSSTDFSLKNQA